MLFPQNYYPSGDYGVDTFDVNNQGKRKLQSQIQAAQEMLDANKLKKRFVWPESLHRDFVSAVFDIGLKNSTSKLLLQMLPQSRKISTGKIYISIRTVIYTEEIRGGLCDAITASNELIC